MVQLVGMGKEIRSIDGLMPKGEEKHMYIRTNFAHNKYSRSEPVGTGY